MLSKFTFLTSTALISGLALTAPAHALEVYKNSTGGTVNAYGQLNFGYLSVDDGESTTGEVVDNAFSNSRVGLKITQPFGENELRFKFETGLGLRSSSRLSQTTTPKGIDWDRTDLRHVDFAWVSPKYGTVSFGQGSMATDGVAFEDDSGTGVIASTGVTDLAGSFLFRDSTGALTGVDIGEAFSTFDGGRRGRIRWDSPNFNGFTVSAAHGTEILNTNSNTDYTDLALRYAGEFGDFRMAAAAGARRIQPSIGSDTDLVLGSVSFEHTPTGLNAALAAGSEDGGGDYYYVKLGYKADFFAVGSTKFSIDFYDGSDMNGAGTSSESIGLAVVQDLDAQNAELFATYREYSYSDGSATSFQDASATMIGARWKF